MFKTNKYQTTIQKDFASIKYNLFKQQTNNAKKCASDKMDGQISTVYLS